MIANRDRAEYVGTFRFIEVFLMETAARWVPTTPELEAKVLFGRHVWEFAQNADALGRRTFELRAQLHLTLPPQEEYVHFLEHVSSIAESPNRLAAIYSILIPALSERYRTYATQVDPVMDEPSLRIIERILQSHARMTPEFQELLADLPQLQSASADLLQQLRIEESATPRVLRGTIPAPARALAVGAAS